MNHFDFYPCNEFTTSSNSLTSTNSFEKNGVFLFNLFWRILYTTNNLYYKYLYWKRNEKGRRLLWRNKYNTRVSKSGRTINTARKERMCMHNQQMDDGPGGSSLLHYTHIIVVRYNCCIFFFVCYYAIKKMWNIELIACTTKSSIKIKIKIKIIIIITSSL